MKMYNHKFYCPRCGRKIVKIGAMKLGYVYATRCFVCKGVTIIGFPNPQNKVVATVLKDLFGRQHWLHGVVMFGDNEQSVGELGK
jgi:hypothetical protein